VHLVYVVLYRLQACRLANPSHVEVQMVFKGQMPQGHQQWDNNDGNNWQVCIGYAWDGSTSSSRWRRVHMFYLCCCSFTFAATLNHHNTQLRQFSSIVF
jgi:hypothetical protein